MTEQIPFTDQHVADLSAHDWDIACEGFFQPGAGHREPVSATHAASFRLCPCGDPDDFCYLCQDCASRLTWCEFVRCTTCGRRAPRAEVLVTIVPIGPKA